MLIICRFYAKCGFLFIFLEGQCDSSELAETGRLASCFLLESGQFTAAGDEQERPRQMIIFPIQDLYIIVAGAFVYYSGSPEPQ